jgi:hypothetical protein
MMCGSGESVGWMATVDLHRIVSSSHRSIVTHVSTLMHGGYPSSFEQLSLQPCALVSSSIVSMLASLRIVYSFVIPKSCLYICYCIAFIVRHSTSYTRPVAIFHPSYS